MAAASALTGPAGGASRGASTTINAVPQPREANMRKLTKIQERLLEAAAARDDGSVLPAHSDQGPKKRPPTTSLKALETRGMIEHSSPKFSDGWRITAAGYEAIGMVPREPTNTKPATKADEIAGLLRGPDGATMSEIMGATRWQAHSVRAAISGLRERGMTIIRSEADDGQSRYCIANARER